MSISTTTRTSGFVADFLAEHGRYPSFYASQAYDTMFFLDSAVKSRWPARLKITDAMRAAMMKAEYPSVRGAYKYGHNHFPIQNFVVREVVEGADGKWHSQDQEGGACRTSSIRTQQTASM